jgi:hypothetical protein
VLQSLPKRCCCCTPLQQAWLSGAVEAAATAWSFSAAASETRALLCLQQGGAYLAVLTIIINMGMMLPELATCMGETRRRPADALAPRTR